MSFSGLKATYAANDGILRLQTKLEPGLQSLCALVARFIATPFGAIDKRSGFIFQPTSSAAQVSGYGHHLIIARKKAAFHPLIELALQVAAMFLVD